MNFAGLVRRVWRALVAAPILVLIPPASAGKFYQVDLEFETVGMLTYFVSHPDEVDPSRPYPVIIHFPAGNQSIVDARALAKSRFARIATDRGYVQVAPAAPDGARFFAEGASVFPDLFEVLKETLPVKDGQFHLMGASSGGVSSLRIASRHPDYVKTAIVYPGFVWPEDEDWRYKALADVCVMYFVGRGDAQFITRQRRDVERFAAIDKTVYAEELAGEGHNIEEFMLDGSARLLDVMESGAGC